jgi:serine/threonine protein phosphatase 1
MVANISLAVARSGNKTVDRLMIKGRVIAIGDVHGCHAELEKLLNLLSLTTDDYVVFLGDLVNRGPNSHRVIEIARSVNGQSLLGNHELRLLEFRTHNDESRLKEDDRRTIGQLTRKDWRYLESMKLTYEVPELDMVLVHGGFLPTQAWQTQAADIVTRIQVIDKNGNPKKRSDCPEGTPWAELWPGPPFVVYGHTPNSEVVVHPSSIGIDTACAMGGSLTAYILPDRKIVQVKAAEAYA